MPRTARASVGGYCYHVLNRGNARLQVFHKADDYDAFITLLSQACERIPVRVLGYCLMPNHFHLVVWPRRDGDLSRWMQWLMTSHVRRYHRHYHSSGHVWQGRFKAFAVASDKHLLTVLRYVERNALRANLVAKAQDWLWSSVRWRQARRRPAFLADGPVTRPRGWVDRVNQPESQVELEALRRSVARGTPYGKPSWQQKTASRLGLESTLRPRGRPKIVIKPEAREATKTTSAT